MTTNDVGKEYLKETNMMFMSGIIVAIAVEHCNLHKRIALNVLYVVGTSPRMSETLMAIILSKTKACSVGSRLMLGFMITTAFLSMWISNTATTAMMVPIVGAVMAELERDLSGEGGSGSDDFQMQVEENDGEKR